MKSFRPKGSEGDDGGSGRNAERNLRGEKRSNETHESTSDPEARLYRKGDGQPAMLCYMGHALMENRHGLVVGGLVTRATGTPSARQRSLSSSAVAAARAGASPSGGQGPGSTRWTSSAVPGRPNCSTTDRSKSNRILPR
jgi:hypothetical protein